MTLATRIAIVRDIFSPLLTTARDGRVGAQFTALRYFALDGTDHASHKDQASMIRRYIIWRNNSAYDERLRQVVTRAT